MKRHVFMNSMSCKLERESNSCETEATMNADIMYTWGGVTGQVVWFCLLCQSRLLCIQKYNPHTCLYYVQRKTNTYNKIYIYIYIHTNYTITIVELQNCQKHIQRIYELITKL